VTGCSIPVEMLLTPGIMAPESLRPNHSDEAKVLFCAMRISSGAWS